MTRTSPESQMHKRCVEEAAPGPRRTGICCTMAGTLLGREQIKKKRVYRPELCIPPDTYIQEQAKVGMEIEETVKSQT